MADSDTARRWLTTDKTMAMEPLSQYLDIFQGFGRNGPSSTHTGIGTAGRQEGIQTDGRTDGRADGFFELHSICLPFFSFSLLMHPSPPPPLKVDRR